MLPGQMWLWQLESVLDVPKNMHLKLNQNRVSCSWDIPDIGFVWWGVWVWYAKSFLCGTLLRVSSVNVEFSCGWVGALKIWDRPGRRSFSNLCDYQFNLHNKHSLNAIFWPSKTNLSNSQLSIDNDIIVPFTHCLWFGILC